MGMTALSQCCLKPAHLGTPLTRKAAVAGDLAVAAGHDSTAEILLEAGGM